MVALVDLSLGDAVRYTFDDGGHMDGVVRGIKIDGVPQGTFDLPGCDEDCVAAEFLVVDERLECVTLACRPEHLTVMSDPEWCYFLHVNVAEIARR